MKKLILLFSVTVLLIGCSKDELRSYNPYLPNYAVNFQINTTLPTYSRLQYPGNAVMVYGYGINGVMVLNNGSGFVAYEATCSNHEILGCSALILNGVEATCSCDDLVYNLYLGIADAPYPLKQYRVTQNGPMLTIYN
nr:hypothetical protein [uncultured Flavobacterium sp.]